MTARDRLAPALTLALLALADGVLAAGPALAASSPWVEAQGGRLRVLVLDAPQDRELRGALQIELEPGWKTYWRDPGEAGVPPQVTVEGSLAITGVTIEYPAPQWVNDGYSTYAAYTHSVTLPLRFAVTGDGTPWRLEAQVFAGICEKVCIPVQATLTVEPGQGEDASAAIAAAFATLPVEAAPGFRISALSAGPETLTATVELPATAKDAALFLAGGDGWYLGAGKRNGDGTFTVPVFSRPKDGEAASAPQWHYTLTAGPMAVSGTTGLTGR